MSLPSLLLEIMVTKGKNWSVYDIIKQNKNNMASANENLIY